MFLYEKKLQYPVKIANPNPKLAKVIISQVGGPDGELGASMRYLNQRYSMPYDELKGLLTDIGTEELGHMEMVAAIIHQLTRKMSTEEIIRSGLERLPHRCLRLPLERGFHAGQGRYACGPERGSGCGAEGAGDL